MKRRILILIVTGVLLCSSVFSQCQDEKAEKLGQYWSREMAMACTSSPNKLKIAVTKCLYDKNLKDGTGGWKIWTSAEWQGKYTTLNYSLNLYIEDTEPNGKQPGATTIFFIDYSNTLTYNCIDLKHTRPLTFVPGTVQYFPVKEFEHRDPDEKPDIGK